MKSFQIQTALEGGYSNKTRRYEPRVSTQRIATRNGSERGPLVRASSGDAPTETRADAIEFVRTQIALRQRPLMQRMLAFLRKLLGSPMPALPITVSAPVPVDEIIHAPATIVPIGATPIHYRAFSILQPRIINDERDVRAHPSIVTFRERAKAIRELSDPQVADAAGAVLDTFVKVVDAFTPLWDAAGKSEELLVYEIGEGARVALHAEILETVTMLDAELAKTLSGQSLSRERFDTVQRYVEMRYGTGERSDYGLTSV